MRDKQIDTLKGMGIFFVVLGHTASIFSPWTYTFHMPLFFFISGFLRHGGREKPWPQFLKGKAKGSLLPYALFWAISLLYTQTVSLLTTRGFAQFGMKQLRGFLLGGQYLAESSDNFPLWYLQLFFIAICCFEWIVRTFRKRELLAAGILLAISTLPIQTWLPGRPVFHINILPAALVFMLMGYGTKALLESKPSLEKWSGSFLAGLVFVVIGALLSLPWDTNVSEIKRMGYFFGAICTIWGFYMMGGFLSRFRILQYLGENSLFILGLHSLLWDISGDLAARFCDLIHLGSATAETLIMVLCSMAICCGLRELWKLACKAAGKGKMKKLPAQAE